MTNIHSYTKRIAKTKEVIEPFANFSHEVFSYDELKEAKVVEVFYDNNLYAVVKLHQESDAGMVVHRLTKKGTLDKRTSEIFIWNAHVNVIYTEATEEAQEFYEFEGVTSLANNHSRFNPNRGSIELGKLKRVCYIPHSCQMLLNQSVAIETDGCIVHIVLEPPEVNATKVLTHRLAKSQKPHRRYKPAYINIDDIQWIYLP